MFTGIALGLGVVTEVEQHDAAKRIGVDHKGLLKPPLVLGNSVLVNGVCLSIVKIDGASVWFDLIPETLRLTTFANIQHGDALNLEKPLGFGDELGGHVIQGHIESVGEIREILDEKGDFRLRIHTVRPELSSAIILKGYIAVDGVSLTVTSWHSESQTFEVALIPDTLSKTTLGVKKVGSLVNLETDIANRVIAQSVQIYLSQVEERLTRLEAALAHEQ